MGTDLIALLIASTLGAAVVVLGLRRNLSETTQNGLPRFGTDSDRATATLGLYEGGKRQQGPLTLRQRRWLASIYLLFALSQAARAVLSPDDKLIHAAAAAFVVLGVAVLLLRKPPQPSQEPAA